MSRNRVLVTGGAGYIGSHAAHALCDRGDEVWVVDNLSKGVRHAVPSRAQFHQADIGDRSAMAPILAAAKPTAILHFAGSVVVPESVAFPVAYFRNNLASTITLIEMALEAGVESVIFSSTAAVYGEPASLPITVDSPTRPINPYGLSKLMVEQVLEAASGAHGLRVGILRYFNVAGADPAGRTGQSTPGATHLIKVACEVAMGKRPKMAIFGTDFPTRDGTGIRDYIHVSDLVDAHVLLLDHLTRVGGLHRFNCGYGQGTSVREVIDVLNECLGYAIPVEIADRRPGDPAELWTESAALRQVLGWTPRFADLRTIVQHALDWERKLAVAGDTQGAR